MEWTVEKAAGWATIITAILAIPGYLAFYNEWVRKTLSDNTAIPALLIFGIAVLCFIGIAAHFGWFKSQELERVVSRIYTDQTVVVDGKIFEDCTFNNVTFRYRGGKYAFVRANITGSKRFETPDLGATGAVNLLKMIQFLEPNFAANWKSIPLEDFKE